MAATVVPAHHTSLPPFRPIAGPSHPAIVPSSPPFHLATIIPSHHHPIQPPTHPTITILSHHHPIHPPTHPTTTIPSHHYHPIHPPTHPTPLIPAHHHTILSPSRLVTVLSHHYPIPPPSRPITSSPHHNPIPPPSPSCHHCPLLPLSHPTYPLSHPTTVLSHHCPNLPPSHPTTIPIPIPSLPSHYPHPLSPGPTPPPPSQPQPPVPPQSPPKMCLTRVGDRGTSPRSPLSLCGYCVPPPFPTGLCCMGSCPVPPPAMCRPPPSMILPFTSLSFFGVGGSGENCMSPPNPEACPHLCPCRTGGAGSAPRASGASKLP